MTFRAGDVRYSSGGAEASPPETGHLATPASRGDRTFVLTFASVFAVFTILLAAIVIFTNAQGRFPSHLVAPADLTDRDRKATIFRQRPDAVQMLILGSSRMRGFNPACVTTLTGLSSFNFSVSSAREEDYLAVLRYVLSTASGRGLQRVLVGIEPDALHPTLATEWDTRSSRHLRPYLDARYVVGTESRLDEALRVVLGREAIHATFTSLRLTLRPGGFAQATDVYEPNGFVIHSFDDPVRRGAFLQDTAVATSIRQYAPVYEDFPELSDVRTAALVEFLREARGAGLSVDVFIPPAHPALVRALVGSSLAARTASEVSLLQRLARAGLLRFIDVRSLDDFGGDPKLFFDGVHMLEPNAARLLHMLYGSRARCAVQ